MSDENNLQQYLRWRAQAVSEKPLRKYRKGSKYDPTLDAFLEGENDLVVVSVEYKDANYLRTQRALGCLEIL